MYTKCGLCGKSLKGMKFKYTRKYCGVECARKAERESARKRTVLNRKKNNARTRKKYHEHKRQWIKDHEKPCTPSTAGATAATESTI